MTSMGDVLVGLAAGDVLGSAAGPDAAPGWSDDTQQALVLAEHLLRHGRVVPDRFARDLLEFAGPDGPPGRYRDIGSGFAAFLDHLSEGADPAAAAQPSAGNGAAMRIAPVAIRFRDDFEGVIDQAIDASLVTHAHPVGVAAAVAVAVALWAAARGQRGPDLVHSAADAAAIAEHRLFSERYERLAPGDDWHTMSEALRAAVGLVGGVPAEIAESVGSRAAETSRHRQASGTDPYAPASVVTALTVAAGSEPPWVAVETLVDLGGDRDTMAAIAGAVAVASGGRPPAGIVPHAGVLRELGERLAQGGDGEGLPPVVTFA